MPEKSVLPEPIFSDHDALNSLLIMAVTENYPDALDCIIETKRADPNATNLLGSSALLLAINNNNVTVVRKLLDANANPNVLDPRGKSVLLRAIENNNIEAVSRLLNAGADCDSASLKRAVAPDRMLIFDALWRAISWRNLNHAVYKRR